MSVSSVEGDFERSSLSRLSTNIPVPEEFIEEFSSFFDGSKDPKHYKFIYDLNGLDPFSVWSRRHSDMEKSDVLVSTEKPVGMKTIDHYFGKKNSSGYKDKSADKTNRISKSPEKIVCNKKSSRSSDSNLSTQPSTRISDNEVLSQDMFNCDGSVSSDEYSKNLDDTDQEKDIVPCTQFNSSSVSKFNTSNLVSSGTVNSRSESDSELSSERLNNSKKDCKQKRNSLERSRVSMKGQEGNTSSSPSDETIRTHTKSRNSSERNDSVELQKNKRSSLKGDDVKKINKSKDRQSSDRSLSSDDKSPAKLNSTVIQNKSLERHRSISSSSDESFKTPVKSPSQRDVTMKRNLSDDKTINSSTKVTVNKLNRSNNKQSSDSSSSDEDETPVKPKTTALNSSFDHFKSTCSSHDTSKYTSLSKVDDKEIKSKSRQSSVSSSSSDESGEKTSNIKKSSSSSSDDSRSGTYVRKPVLMVKTTAKSDKTEPVRTDDSSSSDESTSSKRLTNIKGGNIKSNSLSISQPSADNNDNKVSKYDKINKGNFRKTKEFIKDKSVSSTSSSESDNDAKPVSKSVKCNDNPKLESIDDSDTLKSSCEKTSCNTETNVNKKSLSNRDRKINTFKKSSESSNSSDCEKTSQSNVLGLSRNDKNTKVSKNSALTSSTSRNGETKRQTTLNVKKDISDSESSDSEKDFSFNNKDISKMLGLNSIGSSRNMSCTINKTVKAVVKESAVKAPSIGKKHSGTEDSESDSTSSEDEGNQLSPMRSKRIGIVKDQSTIFAPCASSSFMVGSTPKNLSKHQMKMTVTESIHRNNQTNNVKGESSSSDNSDQLKSADQETVIKNYRCKSKESVKPSQSLPSDSDEQEAVEPDQLRKDKRKRSPANTKSSEASNVKKLKLSNQTEMDVDKSDEDNPSAPKQDSTNNLTKCTLENFIKNKKVINAVEKLNLPDSLCFEDISDDDEVYSLQCPKDFDIESLVGKKISLTEDCVFEGRTKDSETHAYETFAVSLPSKINLLLPSKVESTFKLGCYDIRGSVIISERYDVPDVDMSTFSSTGVDSSSEDEKHNPNKTPLPSGLKIRHPLHGLDYKNKVLPDFNAVKLRERQNKKKKRKHVDTDEFKKPPIPVSSRKGHKLTSELSDDTSRGVVIGSNLISLDSEDESRLHGDKHKKKRKKNREGKSDAVVQDVDQIEECEPRSKTKRKRDKLTEEIAHGVEPNVELCSSDDPPFVKRKKEKKKRTEQEVDLVLTSEASESDHMEVKKKKKKKKAEQEQHE